jgi:hypothetical protein
LTLQPPDPALYTSDTQSNAALWKLGASQRYSGQCAINGGLVLRFGTW